MHVRDRPNRQARLLGHPVYVVGLFFFTLSVLFGSWLARLPEVQAQLGLSDGALGLALLGTPAGSLAVMPLANRIIDRVGPGRSSFGFALLFCLGIVLPALAGRGWQLFLALFAVGLCSGAMNIAMNAAASAVERGHRRHIMSTCHGLFSLGVVLGAGTGGSVAAWGVALPWHLATLGLIFLGLHLANYPSLAIVPQEEGPAAGGLSWPPRPVWGVALVGFLVMIGEGAVADWSAVYLRRDLGSSLAVAGWGYAAFSATMAVGRFFGDQVRSRHTPGRLIILGGLVGGFGLCGVVFSPSAAPALLGFALAGLGYALLAPVLYSEAARLFPERPQLGISAVATAGISGFLLGPPIIGWLAGLFGLAMGLGFAAGLTLAAVLLTWMNGRPGP